MDPEETLLGRGRGGVRGARTLTASEAAAIIGVSVATVRAWADRGILPSHRTVGGHRRFEPDRLREWLIERGARAPEETRVSRRPQDVPPCPGLARWLNGRTDAIADRVLAGYDDGVPTPYRRSSPSALRRAVLRYVRVVAAGLDAGSSGSLAGRAELAGLRGGLAGEAGAGVVAEHARFAVALAAEAEVGIAAGDIAEAHAMPALLAVIDRTQIAVVSGFAQSGGRSEA